jgi:hypothetical protein
MFAIAALACCLPLGLAGALGVLALSTMFETVQPWFLAIAAILLGVGAVQAFRSRGACRRRASSFSLAVLGLSAVIVVAVLAFPQRLAAFLADFVI